MQAVFDVPVGANRGGKAPGGKLCARFGTAMTIVEGVVVRAGIGPGVREEALDFGAQNRPIILHSE